VFEFATGGVVPEHNPTEDYIPDFIEPCTYPMGGSWNWVAGKTVQVEAEGIPQETLDLLYGDRGPSEHAVEITVPSTDEGGEVRKIDFVLYKVQFQPFKFDYWNTWYKKLVKFLVGSKIAYWLFYRKALTVSYTSKALMSEDEFAEKIGRLVNDDG